MWHFQAFYPIFWVELENCLKKKKKTWIHVFPRNWTCSQCGISVLSPVIFCLVALSSSRCGKCSPWTLVFMGISLKAWNQAFGKMLGQIQILACDEILNQSIDLLFWGGQKNSVCFARDTESYETRIQTMHVPDAALGCSAGSLCLVWSALLSKANLCSTFDICKDQSCSDLWNSVWSSKLGAESHSRPVSLPGVPCPQTRTSFLQHKCINSSESLAGFLP